MLVRGILLRDGPRPHTHTWRIVTRCPSYNFKDLKADLSQQDRLKRNVGNGVACGQRSCETRLRYFANRSIVSSFLLSPTQFRAIFYCINSYQLWHPFRRESARDRCPCRRMFIRGLPKTFLLECTPFGNPSIILHSPRRLKRGGKAGWPFDPSRRKTLEARRNSLDRRSFVTEGRRGRKFGLASPIQQPRKLRPPSIVVIQKMPVICCPREIVALEL